ncbi:MAG: bifunctional UDP-sugar hydrolase/5'-nucleotidase, partial [Candidatus Methylomirabilia bacterium]
MERERARSTPLLVLDTGGTFLKNTEDAANAPLAELTSAAMVEGLGKIGYDALNLGRIDLLLPPDLLRKLGARAAFPLLSANIVDAAGKAPFKGWIVKKEGRLRVGIFGLSGNQPLGLPELPGRDLKVRDPVEAARAAVTGLRDSADLVIALSQLGLEGDVRLAREVPGIDIILGGFTRQITPQPRSEGTTLILHSGAKGMQLGRLGLQIIPGRAGAWTARADARGGEARVYDWTLVPLNTALADHPALSALLERHREELRARNHAEQAVASPPPPPPP